MSYIFRKQMLGLADLLNKAGKVLKNSLELKRINEDAILPLLDDCQETAVKMENELEMLYGEGIDCVEKLKEYSKSLSKMRQALRKPEERLEIWKDMTRQAKEIKELVDAQISDKKEIVFLPYKASMWDSMESVWKAACADENCDVYVVPVPYYERSLDGTFREYHYEVDEFPEEVKVSHYENYNVEKHWPDAIYIHNPYDECNLITSVDPRYYSEALRKRTDVLVYIPRYASAGGMEKGVEAWPACCWSNSVIVQSEKHWQFFDPELLEERFLPLGAPQFDHVLRVCKEYEDAKEGKDSGAFILPDGWKERMEGKKVYLCGTGISSMLNDTKAFLKKMEYVFRCFEGREDACLVWRPEPFFELTLGTMREDLKPEFESLKKYFAEKVGIYDETSDGARMVAVCDAYIGDMDSPEMPLCGIAGKPLFLLNYQIDSEPEEGDWRGGMISGAHLAGNDEWMVTQGNKLYRAPGHDYRYRFCCDLSEYASGDYYRQVLHVNGKDYVCPANAQDIIVMSDGKIERRIELEQCVARQTEFGGAVACGKYIFLIPDQYPAVVRYDTETDKVWYFQEYLDIFFDVADGEKRTGGYCVHDGCLYAASPTGNRVWVINPETGEEQLLRVGSHAYGCTALASDGRELWLSPCSGNVVTRWNPSNGEVQEYGNYPDGMTCRHAVYGYECMEQPFGPAVFAGESVYFPPKWANMFMRLDKRTGEMTEWKPPFEMPEAGKNGYFYSEEKSGFVSGQTVCGEGELCVYSPYDRRLYKVNPETDAYEEVAVGFDIEEVKGQEPGFRKYSEWLQYACEENAFNTLPAFLDGKTIGHAFDREEQLRAFHGIAANHDGTCGEKVHEAICREIEKTEKSKKK